MRIALSGAGRMGRAVEAEALGRGHEVVARLGGPELRGLDAGALAERLTGADVVVDFAAAAQVPRTVAAAARAGLPVVVGTTGWSGDAGRVLEPARAAGTGVVHGANFSAGVHVFFRLAEAAARLVDGLEAYDVHVHEAHHRHKVDRPSGTARELAGILVAGVARKTRWSAEVPEGSAPDPETLLVTSVRAGEIPGTHVVGIEGPHDAIELRHVARGREGFAHGAVLAAEWIRGRTGVHTFGEVLDDLIGWGAEGGGTHASPLR